jgi:type IV secretory pathway VirB4 component
LENDIYIVTIIPEMIYYILRFKPVNSVALDSLITVDRSWEGKADKESVATVA